NTFGDRFVVPGVDDSGRSGRFRLFEISAAGSNATIDGFFVPPAARGTVEGRAVEEVLLLRDETANMAWAVEALVQDEVGDPRVRRDEERPPRDTGGPPPPAELRYPL